jgi:hypothetical protein
MIKNYYEILEVAFNASIDEIKKAYRLKAIKYHPDKHFGDTFFAGKFIEVKEAYDILSDPIKKAEYDIKYKEIIIKEEPERKQSYQEEKRKEKEREEKFRYDPYKQFYSTFDREQQETPQYSPKQTSWGLKLAEDFDFFKLPKRIGKIIGGWSTLSKGANAKTSFQVLIYCIKSSKKTLTIALVIILVLYLHWYFNLHEIDIVGFIVYLIFSCIVVGFKYNINSNDVKFEHMNYYVGINGFAIFKCEGKRENIIQSNEINFNDITDLVYREIIKKHNFNYVHTEYHFIWMNTKNEKILYQVNDTYSDEKGENKNLNRIVYPEYTLNKEAEKYWTVYLLDNMEKSLQEKGFLEFNIYSFENNLFQPYIRVGIGFITFLKGKESFTYKFNEIKSMYSKGADLYIEHKNFEKKLYFFKSGNQDKIPLRMVCNRHFFYKAMELLLGYNIA